MMDSRKTKQIGAAMLSALAPVAKEFDCVIAYKGGSYGDTAAILKIEFAERSEAGIVMTQMATDFQTYAESVGLKADDLGKSFERHGNTFKIVGFKPRATKMPVIAERQDGKRFKFREDDVRRGLTG
jgi:hypothetical protein